MPTNLLEEELLRLRSIYKSSSPEERVSIVNRATLIKKAMKWQLPIKTKTMQEEIEDKNFLLKNVQKVLVKA